MNFSLIETILLHEDSVFLLQSHLHRLYNSAKVLGFNYTILESSLKNIDTNLSHQHKDLDIRKSLKLLAKYNLPNIDMQLESKIKNVLNAVKDCHIAKMDSIQNTKQIQQNKSYSNVWANVWANVWDCIDILNNLLQINNTNDIETNNNNANNNSLNARSFSICRLLLTKEGKLTYSFHPLQPITNTKARLTTLNTIAPLSYHKTTKREHFKEATKSIMKNECFDYIYINQNSEILEGSRSNIVIAKNGKYYTSPKSLGILAGVLRNVLIEYGICTEKILYKNDLYEANEIYCVNSIRGIIPIRLE